MNVRLRRRKKILKRTIKKRIRTRYSDGVQRRIAKLTHKWREAERQKDEALTYAKAD